MIPLIIEIIIVGLLAWKLGQMAFDKGHSNALYIILTIICWAALRIFGSVAFGMAFESRISSLLGGWLFGIVSYVILFIIVSKLEDKDEKYDNTDWKNRNDPNSTGTEKSVEK